LWLLLLLLLLSSLSSSLLQGKQKSYCFECFDTTPVSPSGKCSLEISPKKWCW